MAAAGSSRRSVGPTRAQWQVSPSTPSSCTPMPSRSALASPPSSASRDVCATAPPLGQELREWVDQRLGDVEPKSTLGKALRYLDRQWPRLTAFLRDPHMELTNNEVESGLRPWVLDRKRWLFVGHEVSARRTADALTLLTTARRWASIRALSFATRWRRSSPGRRTSRRSSRKRAPPHAERAPPASAAA